MWMNTNLMEHADPRAHGGRRAWGGRRDCFADWKLRTPGSRALIARLLRAAFALRRTAALKG